ncbi:YL1 nuclear domain-containing protein [Trichoderma austrokoningii]
MSTMDPDSAQQSESQLSAPPPLSDLDSSSDSSDSEAGDSSKPQPVEWLATSRSRRSTAGNRMKSMLANEEPDSDLELLFAEDEDDQGFTDAGDDASDVQMDSSSDDEGDNNNNNNAGDELEGEQELERQARERRAAQRKRKAQEAIPAKFRKKVRIHPAVSELSTPAPRPKKKSERTSWLPSPADLPTRASSRKTTRMSKEQLHQQMIEREERRLKQLEQMQKKAARMEALKKPPMTQEDRLREAAVVEKRNSKSLNRWEVAEKQREEERRAKLAALNQRTLKGPVITFWTGLGEARRVVIEEEKPKRKRVDKRDKDKGKGVEAIIVATEKDVKENIAQEGQPQTDASASASVPKPDAAETQSKERAPAPALTLTPTPAPAANETKTADAAPLKPEDDPEPLKSTPNAPSSSQPPNATSSPTAAPAATTSSSGTGPPAASTAKPGDAQAAQPVIAAPLLSPPLLPPPPLSGGLAAPASAAPLSAPPRQTSPLAAPTGVLALPVLAPPPAMNMDFRPGAAPKSNILALPNASLPQTALAPPIRPPAGATHVSTEPALRNLEPVDKSASPRLSEPPSQPAPAEAPETTTRNVIIFQNFDANAIQDRSIQTQILFGRKMNKLSKPAPAPVCVITGLPARYKDPKTGLPYHNVAAYRELQRLGRKELSWSALLNAWVGSEKTAARGVPARFLDPKAPAKTPEEREKERLAQIRAVPPQPQPPQHHQAPPAAVVAAAHKAPQTQLRAPQLPAQQLARPQQPQAPLPQQQQQQQQQLPNRPSPKQQQPVSNNTPSVAPSQAPPPQSSSLPPPPATPQQQQQQKQQPTPTPPPPAQTTQSPVQKTATQPLPTVPEPRSGPTTTTTATTSGSLVAPVEKEPLPTTTTAPE